MHLIIIGGGNSIKSMPTLWDDIIGHDVMTINYAYKFVKETPKYQVSIDRMFWKNNKAEMDKLEACGCKLINRNREYVLVEKYEPKGNMFRGQRKLSGVFALDYAIRKLNYEMIFLFGYDFGVVDGKTHFYDDPKHSGINKSGAYLNGNNNPLGAIHDFENFMSHKIIIVGKSNIHCFPRIDYSGFANWIKELN